MYFSKFIKHFPISKQTICQTICLGRYIDYLLYYSFHVDDIAKKLNSSYKQDIKISKTVPKFICWNNF